MIQSKLALAESQRTSDFAPGERSELLIKQVEPPDQRRLMMKIADLISKGKQKQAAHTVHKLAKQQAQLAPQASYTYIAKYGPNLGPPIAGSRDDPRGVLDVREIARARGFI